MKHKIQLLINALKDERKRFKSKNQDTTDHDITIKYLETSKLEYDPETWELLGASVFDLETMINDYTQCTCKKCKIQFEIYLYTEDCSCNDGADENGNTCNGCGGKGDFDEMIYDICECCLRDSLNYL